MDPQKSPDPDPGSMNMGLPQHYCAYKFTLPNGTCLSPGRGKHYYGQLNFINDVEERSINSINSNRTVPYRCVILDFHYTLFDFDKRHSLRTPSSEKKEAVHIRATAVNI